MTHSVWHVLPETANKGKVLAGFSEMDFPPLGTKSPNSFLLAHDNAARWNVLLLISSWLLVCI